MICRARRCLSRERRGIEARDVRFGIYYGISGNRRAYWDLTNARQDLGYTPEDDAERFA